MDPQHAKMLLASTEFGCGLEMAAIVAMLQVQSVFLEPPNRRRAAQREKLFFSVKEGDHLTLLNVFLAFGRAKHSSQWCAKHYLNFKSLVRAVEINRQMLRYLRRFGGDEKPKSCEGDEDAILK